MGCDINLYAEVKRDGKWQSLDTYTKNPDFGEYEDEKEFEIARENRIYTGGRNYNLFCALTGVRIWEFSGEPKSLSEPKGLPDDTNPRIIEESDSYGSDGHSHSWNTLAELKDFNWSQYGKTCDSFLEEVLPKLANQNVPETDVRIVYFFDN